MTKHMCIKWLKWLQNCVVEGSEQYQALQFAIDYMEGNEDGSVIDSESTVTKQEIVKPYLAKLQSKMKERDEDNGGYPYTAVDQGYHLAYTHLCKEINDLLSESEDKE